MQAKRSIRLLALALALPLTLTSLAALRASGADDESEALAAKASVAYEAGDYREARRLLEQIDAAGGATGPQLYRLYFAQRSTSAQEQSAETLQRARERLEAELDRASGLEVPFYLVNTYINLGLKSQADALTSATTGRIRSGAIEVTHGADMFRAGKLYADQSEELEAYDWFRRAVDTLQREAPGEYDGYVAWAARWLAERAVAAEDWSAAEIYLTALVTHEPPTMADYDLLAVARVRNEMYREAADAWRRSIALDPGNANRPRYCAQLAAMAGRLKELPSEGPDGGALATMSREELELLLKGQADVVRQARLEAQQAGPDLPDDQRKRLRGQIRQARPVFVAAALEYAIKGYNIREAAFFGGFAPLIFRNAEWRLGPPSPETAGSSESTEPEDP